MRENRPPRGVVGEVLINEIGSVCVERVREKYIAITSKILNSLGWMLACANAASQYFVRIVPIACSYENVSARLELPF
jgi:hypothetical protein